jgi:hypothetical protein
VEGETLIEFLKLLLKTQIYFNTYYFIVVKWVLQGRNIRVSSDEKTRVSGNPRGNAVP